MNQESSDKLLARQRHAFLPILVAGNPSIGIGRCHLPERVRGVGNGDAMRVAAGGLVYQLHQQRGTRGSIILFPRRNLVPFLSDDRRLLRSLAWTVAVILENVRFRREQLQLRLLASRAELRALRAQINPHFLFNALSAIAGLIHDQPEAADQTVEELAQVFRYILRRSEVEWVRLEEELEFIASYLRVEQARFGHRLKVSFEADSNASAVPVPAMSIQPIVENAVKHGASQVESGGRIAIRTALVDGQLRIEVIDNGPGFPANFSLNGSGHGLRNVSERLKGYFGERFKLTWKSSGGETRVVVEMAGALSVQLGARELHGQDIDR